MLTAPMSYCLLSFLALCTQPCEKLTGEQTDSAPAQESAGGLGREYGDSAVSIQCSGGGNLYFRFVTVPFKSLFFVFFFPVTIDLNRRKTS
jgi:hypothetical protein